MFGPCPGSSLRPGEGAAVYLAPVGGALSPLVSHAGLIVVVAGAFMVAVVGLAVHRVRKRLRELRSHTAVRSAVALAGVLRSGPGAAVANGPARWRFELWQGVGAATRAVEGAQRAGGPVAELPHLTRRLRATADELDGLLVMATGIHPGAEEVAGLRRHVEGTLEAASAIRRAALASASDAAAARVDALAADAGREVASLSAGIARSRAALARD